MLDKWLLAGTIATSFNTTEQIMATRYEVAFGIKKSVAVPTDLVPFQFGYFEQHQRHNAELGEYTIYHADSISFGHVLDITAWLRGLDVDDYQFVSYSAENEHDIESFGNAWFDICLGLTF